MLFTMIETDYVCAMRLLEQPVLDDSLYAMIISRNNHGMGVSASFRVPHHVKCFA
jgi:non-canonical (house-cleaning) NTP pyrophosphatase